MSSSRELVEFIARALSNHPDEVKVSEVEREEQLIVKLKASSTDLGRLIGRQGRTVSAVRILASVVAEREGKKITVDLLDSSSGLE